MLNKNTYLLLSVVRDYIKQVSSVETLENYAKKNNTDTDWKDIYTIAVQNGVLPFLYHQIKSFNNQYNINSDFLVALKNNIIYRSSRQIKANECLCTIIDSFNKADIPFIILKGIVVAELYPNPEYRYSCDADIHISSEYLEAVQKILIELGYEHKYINTIKHTYSYILHNVLYIDLHTRLFEDFYDKHQKVFEEYEIDSFENTTKYSISNQEFLSLQPNEFLIYIFCHMTKHYVNSGINLRQLMDISIYVNAHINQLEVNYIMAFFKKMGIEKFVLYTFFVCRKYLGMVDIEGIFYDDVDEKVADEIIYTSLENNMGTKSDIERISTTRAYYRGNKQIVRAKLFPKQEELSDRYSYAKKHKILLPIVWCNIAIYYLMRLIKNKKNISLLFHRKSREQIALLKKLGLIK